MLRTVAPQLRLLKRSNGGRRSWRACVCLWSRVTSGGCPSRILAPCSCTPTSLGSENAGGEARAGRTGDVPRATASSLKREGSQADCVRARSEMKFNTRPPDGRRVPLWWGRGVNPTRAFDKTVQEERSFESTSKQKRK